MVAITNILGTDRPADSRTVINNNFTALKVATEALQTSVGTAETDIDALQSSDTAQTAALSAHEADTSTHGVAQVAGIADIPVKATAAEVATGTDDAKFATPLSVFPYSNHSIARQAIINGNFDIWQRSVTTTNPATTTLVADRYKVFINADGYTPPSNIIHSRQSVTPGDIANAFYYYRINPDGAGSSYGVNTLYHLGQRIEHGVRSLAGTGNTITISFWARSSISNKKIGLFVDQVYGTGGSPTSAEIIVGDNWTLTSAWQKITKTITLNTVVGKTFGTANDDYLEIALVTAWGTTIGSRVNSSGVGQTFVGSGTIDIAQLQVCLGSVALPFEPKTFEDELHNCQRYYEKCYQYGVYPGAAITAGNDTEAINTGTNTTTRISLARRFRVIKRIAPTLTVYDWAGASAKLSELNTSDTNTDGISPGYTHADPSGFYVSHSPSTKSGIAFAWTASAEL